MGASFPQSLKIRCRYQGLGNVRQKLPEAEAEEVLAHLRAVRDAPTEEAGRELATRTICRYRDRFPAAMACFADDLEASLAHLRLPCATG